VRFALRVRADKGSHLFDIEEIPKAHSGTL
jgi:hypothetical protein